jgi:serine/threonine protein kinase/tetratricopeptide (TPR) repeat protein
MTEEGLKSFGHYEILSKIGSGGMGDVYLARDNRLDRNVAIKFLPAEFSTHSDRLNRFIQEAKSASALNHPNILTIYEIGTFEDTHYMSAEYIDGKTLRQKIAVERFSFEQFLAIAVQTAEALAAAHSAGIIHRDVKPENIMIREDGYLKVLDFGLAKLAETIAANKESKHKSGMKGKMEAATQLMVKTNPGVILGTASYMSPEQARGKDTDARSDIFSFGIVLYEMLSGQPPFQGETVADVLAAVLNNEPVPLQDLVPDLPKELLRIIGKTLRKNRDQRYQSTKDLLGDLRDLREEMAGSARLGASTGSGRTAVTSRVRTTTSSGGRKDALVLTEFENNTDDPIFDSTLKTALAFSLEQSPYLNIFPDAKVRETLRLMERPENSPITREIGNEICQRQGLKAFVAGSISNFGSSYVLTLEAVNALNGETIGRQFEQCDSKEHVLQTLGRVATGLREQLGESLSSIERFDAPLEEATTTSLEALKLFSLGEEQTLNGKHLEAIPFYRKAVEIDPGFAYALCRLGVQYYNSNQPGLSAAYIRRAYTNRESASELEKLRITFFYHAFAAGDTANAIETAELYRQTYPRDWRALNYLTDRYMTVGQYEKAVKAAHEALRLNPNASVVYENLLYSLIRLSHLDEAEAVGKKMTDLGLDSDTLHTSLFQLAYLAGGKDRMEVQLKWLQDGNSEYEALNLQAGVAASAGRWRTSQELSRKSCSSAQKLEAPEIASLYAAEQALRIVFWSSPTGFPESADPRLAAAVRSQANKVLQFRLGMAGPARATLALAAAGDETEAGKLTHDLHNDFPKHTLVNELWLPTIRAASHLHERRVKDALSDLAEAERLERAGEFYPQYLRAIAYIRSNDPTRAEGEFEKILANRGEAVLSSIYPLAQLGKARITKKRIDYEKFFEMWTSADDDMPALKAAKKEYESLP